MWRLFLFLLFPALELYLLVKAGAAVGAAKMVLWVFGSAFLGIWVARAHSQYSMRRVRMDTAEGRAPQNAVLEGLFIFFAGILLILPGLITDAVGILLLIPPLRHSVAVRFGRYLESKSVFSSGSGGTTILFSRGFGARSGGDSPQSEEDRTPRQATIIESTAIDITGGEDGRAGKDGGTASSGGKKE